MPDCLFCHQLQASPDTRPANPHAAAIPDTYPLTPGHTLIVSRRHVARYLDLSPEEQAGLWELVPEVWNALTRSHAPAGFNLGLNDGTAAGQTVGHVHVHLIPRYPGDTPDPRGGVRWIIPDKAAWWEEPRYDER